MYLFEVCINPFCKISRTGVPECLLLSLCMSIERCSENAVNFNTCDLLCWKSAIGITAVTVFEVPTILASTHNISTLNISLSYSYA